jgi:membrane protein DedA with SNARE-associated domain
MPAGLAFSSFVESWGYLAVFVMVAVESLGIPLPGETILITAAIYAGVSHSLAIPAVIAAAALGAVVGGTLGYGIGWWGGYRLLVRFGRYVRLGQPEVKIARYAFRRHGGTVVFLGRFVAVLRSYAPLLAGASRMNRSPFLACNAAGGAVWATVWGVAAFEVGRQIGGLSWWADLALGLVGVVGVVVAVILVRRQRARLHALAEAEFPGPLQGYPGGRPL